MTVIPPFDHPDVMAGQGTLALELIEDAGLTEDLGHFYDEWIGNQEDPDESFMRLVGTALGVDAVVVGAVHRWRQDEVRAGKSGTARTEVGLMIGVFDPKTGKQIWRARDANAAEGRFYNADDGGGDDAAPDLEAYAPPDFSEVVDLVVNALVAAFPKAAL